MALLIAFWQAQLRIQYLQPIAFGSGAEDAEKDMAAVDVAALKVLASDPVERARFWAFFWSFYQIECWGFSVYQFNHDCFCRDREGHGPRTPCKYRGRRMLELASGKAMHFLRELEAISVDSSEQTMRALATLETTSPGDRAVVVAGFMLAKRKMHLRFQQGSSFYSEFPWNVCALLAFTLEPAGEKRSAATQVSKALADKLVEEWSSGKLPKDTFASKFFQEPFLASLQDWTNRSTVMELGLFKELLGYALALTSMQRLESRHHLINLKVSPGRASSAALVSANLRRRLNPDCRATEFRVNLERYMEEFDKLVPETWDSMTELHRLITGHRSDLMYRDTNAEDTLIAAAAIPKHNDSELVLLQQHLKVMLDVGAHYAVPINVLPDGGTLYDFFQLVNRQPGSKKYLQKILKFGDDAWQQRVAVVHLGRLEIESAVICVDDDNVSSEAVAPAPLPHGFSIPCHAVTEAQPVPVRQFFKFGFSNIYKFAEVSNSSEICLDAIEAAATGGDQDPMFSSGDEDDSASRQLSLADDPARLRLACNNQHYSGLRWDTSMQ